MNPITIDTYSQAPPTTAPTANPLKLTLRVNQGETQRTSKLRRQMGVDTQGFRDLLDLVDQTCNDSWELFTDLQHYNPYTKTMVKALNEAFVSIDERLKEGKK